MNHNGAHCTLAQCLEGEQVKYLFSKIIYVKRLPTAKSPAPPKIQPKKATFLKDISKVWIVCNKGNKG